MKILDVIQCYITSPVSVPSSCVRQLTQDVPAKRVLSNKRIILTIVKQITNQSREICHEEKSIMMAKLHQLTNELQRAFQCRSFLFFSKRKGKNVKKSYITTRKIYSYNDNTCLEIQGLLTCYQKKLVHNSSSSLSGLSSP